MIQKDTEPRPLPNREMLFSGKHVVITGGGSGIGAAMAEQFHQCGAQVQIIDIVDSTSEEISFAQADVTDKELLNTKAAGQQVDILVIAAGVTSETNDPSAEEQELMRQVNIRGVENTLEVYGPQLPTKGQVIYIGTHNPPKAFYAQTKESGAKLVRAFAAKHPNLKVKIVLLGPVRTQLFEKGKTTETIERIAANVGLYEPTEFAGELIDQLTDQIDWESNLEEVVMYKSI